MKKKFFIPMALVMSIMMAVPVFAQHIYIGDTETVISYDENGNKVITLIFDPAKTPDYMKPDSPNYWRKVEQERAQAEQGVDFMAQAEVIYTAQPENETLPQTIEPQFQPIPPLTEAPEVGTVLAEIQQENENGEMCFTKPYDGYSIGQCTWYARGRFQEIYGTELPFFGNARIWAEKAAQYPELRVINELDDVPEQAVAVYAPRTDMSLPGHVCFIEYVERDSNGKPQNIYYTDANGKYDTEKNAFTAGCDGMVVKESFDEFQGTKKLKLVGYILPR